MFYIGSSILDFGRLALLKDYKLKIDIKLK